MRRGWGVLSLREGSLSSTFSLSLSNPPTRSCYLRAWLRSPAPFPQPPPSPKCQPHHRADSFQAICWNLKSFKISLPLSLLIHPFFRSPRYFLDAESTGVSAVWQQLVSKIVQVIMSDLETGLRMRFQAGWLRSHSTLSSERHSSALSPSQPTPQVLSLPFPLPGCEVYLDPPFPGRQCPWFLGYVAQIPSLVMTQWVTETLLPTPHPDTRGEWVSGQV